MGLEYALAFWLMIAAAVGLALVGFGLLAMAGPVGPKCELCRGRRTVYYPHSGERKVCPWCGGTGRR